MKARKRLTVWVFLIGSLGWLACLNDYVSPQTPYYQGKTITILRGGTAGGMGDVQTRALIPFLRRYIPGEPAIVIEYMPGAAGRKGVNYIYSMARPDGLTMGAVGAGLVIGPILGLPGTKYDLDRLIYLGSTESGDSPAFGTRKEAGLDSLEKLRAATGIKIGGHAVGHITYVNGRLFAYLLGLREPRFVVGYSGPELEVALLRGEVDARSITSTTIQINPELLERAHFHAIIAVPKGKYYPPFSPHLPEIDLFARTEKEREVLRLYRGFVYPRWPFILSPGTPKELVDILREAMAKTLKDPGFSKEFRRLAGRDPSPLTGEELEKAVKELPRNPEVVDLYKKIASHGPLPPR